MKKRILAVFATLLIAVVGIFGLTACGNTNDLVITGSSSVAPLMQKLVAEYEKTNSNVTITVQTSDSTKGVTDALNGTCDIGMASRGLKSNETGVTSKVIAYDGIAIIVNKDSSMNNITSAEAYNLYANGTAITAGDISITKAISREDGSGTRDAFDGLIKDGDNKLSGLASFNSCVEIQNSTGAVKLDISGNTAKDKIGYISMGSIDNTIKALTFNGVEATGANVKNGTYSLSRPFNIVYKDYDSLSDNAKAFITFIMSTEGQKVVTSNGYVEV